MCETAEIIFPHQKFTIFLSFMTRHFSCLVDNIVAMSLPRFSNIYAIRPVSSVDFDSLFVVSPNVCGGFELGACFVMQ